MSDLSLRPPPAPRWMVADSTREVFLAVCVGPLVVGAIAGALARWALLEDDSGALGWAVILLLLTVFGACAPTLYAAYHFSEDLARFAVRHFEGVLHVVLAIVGSWTLLLAGYTAATGPSVWSWGLVVAPVLVGGLGSLALSRAEPRPQTVYDENVNDVLVRRARRVGLVVGVLVGVLLGVLADGWFGACAGAYCGASIGLAVGRGVAELITVPREQWARRGNAFGSLGFGAGAGAGAVVGGLGVAAWLGAPDWTGALVGFLAGGLVIGGGVAAATGGGARWPATRATVPTIGVLLGLGVAAGVGIAVGSPVLAVVLAPVTGAIGCAWALFVIADF